MYLEHLRFRYPLSAIRSSFELAHLCRISDMSHITPQTAQSNLSIFLFPLRVTASPCRRVLLPKNLRISSPKSHLTPYRHTTCHTTPLPAENLRIWVLIHNPFCQFGSCSGITQSPWKPLRPE